MSAYFYKQVFFISIHAPREGGDEKASPMDSGILLFQSTPPARGATANNPLRDVDHIVFQSTPPARGATVGGVDAQAPPRGISIHAPREGGDTGCRSILCYRRISIHAPREGGDDGDFGGGTEAALFQSTPPARGATAPFHSVATIVLISIHAPREGGDCVGLFLQTGFFYFNPRPPRGGRRWRA